MQCVSNAERLSHKQSQSLILPNLKNILTAFSSLIGRIDLALSRFASQREDSLSQRPLTKLLQTNSSPKSAL